MAVQKSAAVAAALIDLIGDQDVALHAMSALRRTVGPQAALPHLERVANEHDGDAIGQIAARQIRKAAAASKSI